MARLSTLVSLALAAGTASSVARAQSWLNPVDGSWFDATKWSAGVVPSGAGATGTLGLSGPYSVATTSNTLLSVNITNPAARLMLGANNTLVLTGSAPGVVNSLNGELLVNQTGSYAGTTINVGGAAVAFSGTGKIVLNASTSDGNTTANTAAIVSSGGSLTMGAGTALTGFGILNGTPSINNGTYAANVAGRPLRIEGQTHANNGLYTAANTGALVISNATINQGAGGSMAPGADSSVQLHNSAVHGGSLTSAGTGRVMVAGGGVTLGNVAINGGMDISPTTTTYVDGPWTLNGGATVTVNVPGSYAGTLIRAAMPNAAINGNGTVRLNASTSDGNTTANTAALAAANAGDSFVFAPQVTVAGFGIISGVPTVNNGIFNADVNNRPLRVEGSAHQNNAVYKATNGGVLLISGTSVTQSIGGTIMATGAGDGPSSVQLSNAGVAGGTLLSDGAAHVGLNGGTSASLANVSLMGQFDQGAGSTLFVDAPGVGLAAGSTLLVNASGAYAGTLVRTGEPVLFSGLGTVRLNASTSDGNTTANTAALAEDGGDAGGEFTFGPNTKLAGFGIVNGVPTVNNGTFNADIAGRPLRLEGSTHQNNTLYTSSNGGYVLLSSTTVNQAAGARVYAGDGSGVVLASSRVVGGTVGSPAGGTGNTALNNSTSALDGVTVSRQLTIDPSGVLTTTGLTLSNNALLTVNTNAAYAGTHMRAAAAPTVIGGTGTVRLNASTSDGNTTAGTADMRRDGGVAGSGFAFGAGVKVDGFGRIVDCPTTNSGIVEANVAGRPLRIEGNVQQNNGTYRSLNGGYLDLVSTTVVQTGLGVINAGDGSAVNMTGSDLSGGTLSASGSGRFNAFNGTNLHDLVSNGPIDVMAGNWAAASAPGVTNNGVIKVNHNGAYAGTSLRAGGVSVAVNGGGSVVLNRSSSDGNTTAGTADLGATAVGHSWSFGAGQTLSGLGRIIAPVEMAGVIAPGFGTGANGFIRNESTVTFTPTGRLHIDIATTNNYDTLQNAGTVNLDGSLQVAAATDFPAGTTFDVITGPHAGEFDVVLTTGLAMPKRFGARYDNPGRVRITVLCGPADIAGQGADGNGDGILDNNDFVVFIDRFFAQDPRADFGRQGGEYGTDGLFNNNDFVVFIDLFFAGCF